MAAAMVTMATLRRNNIHRSSSIPLNHLSMAISKARPHHKTFSKALLPLSMASRRQETMADLHRLHSSNSNSDTVHRET